MERGRGNERKEGKAGILKWRQDKRTANRANKNCRRKKRKDKKKG